MYSPFVVRTSCYLFGLVVLLVGERFAPYAGSEQKKSFRFLFHLGMSVVNSIALNLLLAGPIFAALAYTGSHGTGIAHLLGLRGGVEILATVIAFDFWDYWMHLANHRIGLLWRFHKAHHSDMEIDVTTAARFHIGELVISGGVKCLMVLAWGPSLWGLAAFEILLSGASQFHHSNLKIPFAIQDRLERFIVTPRMHRCHHALHQNCFNTNFSTVLSLWDRLFGSYHLAGEPKELTPIGLLKPRGAETMQLVPFLLTPVKGE
jgi:sterol desaturase/sphingolipid hydroxylase (fatty acid hydroxylase superfamily)